jgi:hypothetical protein
MSISKNYPDSSNRKINPFKTNDSYTHNFVPAFLPLSKFLKSPNNYKTINSAKKNLKEIQNSVIRRPFGGTEQRFLWQKDFKNQNSHSIGIKGKPPSALKIKNDFEPEIKKVLFYRENENSSFEPFNDAKTVNKSNRISTNKKLAENIISKRVIDPTVDVKIFILYTFSKPTVIHLMILE